MLQNKTFTKPIFRPKQIVCCNVETIRVSGVLGSRMWLSREMKIVVARRRQIARRHLRSEQHYLL